MAAHDREGAWRLESPSAHRTYYDEWAPTYEETFLSATGYRVPEDVARVFLERSGPSDSPVADLGCGTGALGRALGRADVEGFDISPGMLDQARSSGAYRDLHCVDLTSAEPARRFGGIVSSGTFTMGHLGPEGLDMVLGLGRREALVVIGVNARHFAEAGFAPALAALMATGRITDPDVETVASYAGQGSDGSDENSTCLVAFRILSA